MSGRKGRECFLVVLYVHPFETNCLGPILVSFFAVPLSFFLSFLLFRPPPHTFAILPPSPSLSAPARPSVLSLRPPRPSPSHLSLPNNQSLETQRPRKKKGGGHRAAGWLLEEEGGRAGETLRHLLLPSPFRSEAEGGRTEGEPLIAFPPPSCLLSHPPSLLRLVFSPSSFPASGPLLSLAREQGTFFPCSDSFPVVEAIQLCSGVLSFSPCAYAWVAAGEEQEGSECVEWGSGGGGGGRRGGNPTPGGDPFFSLSSPPRRHYELRRGRAIIPLPHLHRQKPSTKKSQSREGGGGKRKKWGRGGGGRISGIFAIAAAKVAERERDPSFPPLWVCVRE